MSFPEQIYDVKGATRQMTINIPAGQDYLNDVSFWFNVEFVKSDGNKMAEFPINTISEMHHLI